MKRRFYKVFSDKIKKIIAKTGKSGYNENGRKRRGFKNIDQTLTPTAEKRKIITEE